MLKPDPAPRMPPVAPEDYTDETRQFFARWTRGFLNSAGATANPVLRTLAHHPRLAELFSQLNVHLLTSNTIPVKLRQIAIMRTAWICNSAYMWSSHLNTSALCGLDPAMYRPIQNGAADPHFTAFERTVIEATEELVFDKEIGDAKWRALAAEWDNRQMLDFIFTVGCYVLVAGAMRSTGVQRDRDLLELAETYGAPDAGR